MTLKGGRGEGRDILSLSVIFATDNRRFRELVIVSSIKQCFVEKILKGQCKDLFVPVTFTILAHLDPLFKC